MTIYTYKVIPAPVKGVKTKTAKTPEARFAHALELVMNDMAADGWEFQRAETLPSEERQGLTGKATTFRNVLVFRCAVKIEVPEQETVIVPEHTEPDLVPDGSGADMPVEDFGDIEPAEAETEDESKT